jgi:hypothetical protein
MPEVILALGEEGRCGVEEDNEKFYPGGILL